MTAPFLSVTLALCYFLRTDSTVSRKDGVASKTSFSYEPDGWRRLLSQTTSGNGEINTSRYTYVTSPSTTGPLRRYRSVLSTVSAYSGETLSRFRGQQYRQESRPNGGEIYRLFRDSSWLDNGDHIPAASDVFPIRADSADDWGDTVQWTNPDGTQGHRIFNNKGIEAEISNSDNSSYAYYSAESFCNRQPASWVINGSRSAKQAFTGTYSIEGTAGTAAEVLSPIRKVVGFAPIVGPSVLSLAMFSLFLRLARAPQS